MFVDTHCHIHEPTYQDAEGAYTRALESGVSKIVCVGTDNASSIKAVEFAKNHENSWASIGVHPHDSKLGCQEVVRLVKEAHGEIIAIGEIGLDYFYTHSPRDVQIATLEAQLQLAIDASLPVIFHVREAFDDFWPIFSNFPGVQGVLHSFTDSAATMERALGENLYFGLNGISTFTKDAAQRDMFNRIPLEKMLLETDSPFLTPSPYRGKVNEPAFVRQVAEHHALQRDIELDTIARVTSANATSLFSI